MEQPLLELVMIVKDEARSIVQTLESAKPYIDRWTILDTGSTDSTQDLIRSTLGEIPGQLLEEPFVDFGTTRSRVLDLAGTASVFTLMLSGDESLVDGDKLRAFCKEQVRAPQEAYFVEVRMGEESYDSARLALTAGGWRYAGVTHEVLVKPGRGGAPALRAPGAYIFHDVSHRDRPSAIKRWERDLVLLSAAREQNPIDTRTVFYLAQTLECLGRHEEAGAMYKQRVEQGGWAEEVYESLYRIARCALAEGAEWSHVQQLYLDAHAHSPHRAEALYCIAKHWYEERNYPLTYLFALRGASIPYPMQSRLFVEHAVYEWKLNDLLGISAFYVGERAIGKAAVEKALEHRPGDAHLLENLRHYDKSQGPVPLKIADEDLEALRARLGSTKVIDLTYDGPLYQLGDHSRGSGPGSEPAYTEGYRAFLAAFMRENNIKSVLDLGCGNWTSTRLIDWTGVDYLGVDFIHKIVARNRRLYGTENIKFAQGDVRTYDIPPVDLVISKDVLQHWPSDSVVSFLGRLQASPAKMALLVNCANVDGHPHNRDIAIGAFRPIHLNDPPFSAGLEEVYAFHTKKALLWRRPEQRDFVEGRSRVDASITVP